MTNNNQTVLKFTQPIYLKEYFAIPEDTTSWNKDYFDYVSGEKKTRYFRPNRERADFMSHENALITLSDSDIKNFIPKHGIYILVFQHPSPAIYVGIATENSTETITSRIKKHRVKITASNVGAKEKSVGGVSHTKGWRNFAPGRFDYFNGIGEIDTCQDVRLITGKFKVSSGSENYKKEAEYFERMIESNENTALDSIISRLWPNEKLKHENIEMITTSVSRGIQPHNPVIQLWDNKLITVDGIDKTLENGDINICNEEIFLEGLDPNSLYSWQYFLSNLDCSESYLNYTATNNYDCRFMFDTGTRSRVLGRVFWQPKLQRFCFHLLADHNLINTNGIINSEPHVDGAQQSRFYLNIEQMKDTKVIGAVSNALKLGIEKV